MRRELAEACLVFFVNFGAFNLKRLGCVLGGDLRAAIDPLHTIACGPANGIAQNQPDMLIIINRIGLVAGAEVKDFAVATFPSATRAENLAALEPRNENNLLGGGYGERLAIHFDVLDFEVAINPARDRMGGVANPEAFLFAGLAPDDGAARAH